jgi:chromosomal replication initiator protein
MIAAKETWEAVLGKLQLQITKTNYDTWLGDTVGLSCERNQFVVGVTSPFAVEWLERRLRSLIKKTLMDITGRDVDVKFQVQRVEGKYPSLTKSKKRWLNFNPKYTFDSFIIGNCNRLAHAAAIGVAEKPGAVYNPLFIYGGVGLGKTHLLHAIGNLVSQGNLRVLYVSTEQFTNDFIRAIKERKTEEFRQKYRSVDLLLIDDVQFIIGKEQTQEGFFHTFNDLHNENRQIVVTSDRSPKDMPLLENRLRSRFEWGLIADIQPPDLETRFAILEVKAEQQRIVVPRGVIEFIARKARNSIRDLEGSLNRIIAFAELTKAPITIDLAVEALESHSNNSSHRTSSPLFIIDAVAKYFDLVPAALKGRARDRQTALARHIAVFLIKEETERSFADIGRELGGRDHSVILRSYQKISSAMEDNQQLRSDILEIRSKIQRKASSGRPALSRAGR